MSKENGFNLKSVAIAGGVFVGFCAGAIILAGRVPEGTESGPWYSILPPLLAVTLALVTRRLITSLVVSIVVGGLLAVIPQAPGAIGSWGRGLVAGPSYVWGAVSDTWNLQVLAFVVLVLAMISVMVVAGGLQGIVDYLSRYARGPRSTQFVTALMGLAVFIDDYANTMIIGTSMKNVTDEKRISREKLAFLVDATSAPIAGVALISTWIGYEVGLFGQVSKSLDLGRDGYSMFFDALGFRFYCILMIVFVIANVLTGRDFGPMARERAGPRATENSSRTTRSP